MKTQFKRFSKSTISVLLAVCLLFSCMTVGIIATSAAQDDSEAVGYDEHNLGSSNIFYFDNSSTKWSSVKLMVMKKNGGSWSGGPWNLTQVSGTDYWYWNGGQSWNGYTHYLFYSGTWGNATQTDDIEGELAGSSWYTNCFTPSGGSSSQKWSGSFDKCVGVKNYSVTASNTNSGSGTSSSPYLVNTGASVTLTASATAIDTNCTVNYKFNSGSYSTTTKTNTFTASSTANTEFTKTVTVKTTRGNYSSREETKTIYFKTVTPVTDYTGITAVAKGTTDGTNYGVDLGTIQSSTTVSSSTGLAVNAGTQSGYTFYKWVASGSGTFDNANSDSTTFHPAANSEVATAQYKKNYTFSNGTTDTHGTVTVPSGTQKAGDPYSGTVTPAAGYKIKTLTVGGVAVSAAVGKTSAYTYSGTTGSSTTGTTTPISVVASFEPITNLQLYIAGRFRVRPSAGSSSWTTTYASGSDWNATSTNIPFTYVSGTTYKVDTYASLAELSAKPTNNQDPWFFVYDKTNSKAWHPTTQNRELGTTTEYNLTTNTDTYNVRFNSSSTDSPVTIYFDYNTKRLWYSVPDLYDVTCSTATGGTVTASPSRCEAGTAVTLTIAPTDGWELTGITTSPTVTLNGTGSTRTFTMPEGNVTVTPVFEKISYAVSVDAKYSNDGTNFNQTFPSGSKPAVTIAANTATQLDGVAVTAPATDPTGYVFAGWYTTKGSFTNAANKDTTFKPNAANAVAIAKYKKIFSITSSVDNTGTGAGTVTTSVASVEAGGSYTITAGAKSGSAVESVKVNGTAKTATASQTISSVSANQSVVAKFKSNVYLKGTMNATAWAGDVMQANSEGTTYTISDVVLNAGTTYQFRHWVDSGGDGTWSSTVDTWTLNNIATHGTSGDNLTIKPSVKAKVTFVSNGSKFTSITAIPYDSTQYNVTLTQSADYTITATYMGVEYTTAGKSANVTVPVYSGTGFSYTVTPASGKYLSAVAQSESVALSPAFVTATHANSYTGTVSSVSKAFAVSATAAAKLAVSAKTNKSARGTVSVDKTTAAPGETIKITVSPKNGTLKTLTLSHAGGATYKWNGSNWVVQASSLNATQLSVEAVSALIYDFFGKFDYALGAASGDEAVGADQTINYTLPSNASGAITINATFDAYSGESNWYYNGYDTSGNKVTSYWGQQMTEGMVSGEKFSYYHVEGRTGSDQLFTVSNGRVADTRYVYFTRPKSFDYWNKSNTPKAHFWKNGGSESDTWPGNSMTWVYDNDMGEAVFKIAIPVGADRVSFNDASNNGQQQTVDIDLTNTSGAYYVSGWNSSANKYNYGTWNTGYDDQGWIASGTEYFYDSTRYTADFSTKGFYNHNTNSKDYTKPKDLGTNTGDYYINVLYSGKTYTINGVTKTVGAKDLVIWSKEPLAGDDDNVKVYAKDGAIRSESFGSTYANIADTKIYSDSAFTTAVGTDHSGNISGQTYETYNASLGETIYIKTTINTTAGTGADTTTNRNKYYVRGFCINGEVFELKTWVSSGVYTTSYKIPEDYEGKYVEITPIYYLKDTSNHPIVTYRVTGFTDALKEVGTGKPGWGDTLYTYPFYGKLGSNNNALGAYPGQPMVYYKGQYQMQIPEQSTAWDVYLGDSALSGTDEQKKTQVANTNVSGVTMSNGYYDIVHRQIMGYGNNGSSSDHVQTYDYGDFFKIFNEKSPVDNIVFDFKYETKKHNFENQPAASVTKSTLDTNYGTNGNGFELLTNFHGKHVDLFGTPLSGDAADPSKTTPVYVVSIGGVNGSAGVENIAGYYATEWMVYGSSNGTDYTRITAGNKNSIPPEVLVLNDDDATSFNTTTYPSADANHQITDWQALYTALEAYRGKPVMISYEAADAQIGAGNYATSGGGGATRNDGRWLYSKNGETITSNIRVDVSHDSGATYVENPASGAGHVDNIDAYFTNADAYGQKTYTTTIDPDKTFDMEAKTTNASYKFVGWYMADGTKITSDNVTQTERSGSYTFVARFMEVTSGQLVLSHNVGTGETVTVGGVPYTCNGSGSAKISAVVTDHETQEVLSTYELGSSDITIGSRFIGNDKNYDITVTLVAEADTNTALGTTKLTNTSESVTNARFFNYGSYTESGKQRTYTFSFNVQDDLYDGTTQRAMSLIYNSYFIQYMFNYHIGYEFADRNGRTQSYKRDGVMTPAEADEYVYKSGENRFVKKSFIEKLAPVETNFGQSITWSFKDEQITTGGSSGATYNYDITLHYIASQTNSNKRNVTFKLPYAHTNGVAALDSNGAGTYATTTDYELTGNYAVNFGEIPVLKDNAVNNIYSEDGKKHWVAAPKTIKDGSNTYTFSYWSVKTTEHSAAQDPDIFRCYYQGFNFVAYDNYVIEAVYSNTSSNTSGGGTGTSITFVETTRNQWNAGGVASGKNETMDNDGVTQRKAADLLYNDFIVSYSYNGKEIYKGEADNDIADIGIIVERVQELEPNQDGTLDTTISRYTSIPIDNTKLNAAINGTGTDKKFSRHQIAKNEGGTGYALDNKDRIQLYDAFYNSAGWTPSDSGGAPAQTYTYKNWVYRAYSYIKTQTGTIIVSDPAYFTMYDEATANYSANNSN